MAKILLASSLDFVRAATQLLQALTTLLLTVYTALLVAFVKEIGFRWTFEMVGSFLPIVLWFTSLAISFTKAVTYSGTELIFNDAGAPVEPMDAYAKVSRDRRNQLIGPAIATGVGVLVFGWVFFAVFVPTASERLRNSPAKTEQPAANVPAGRP
ncbi:MAG TPA: hypothetical protein VH120_05290 [Gemmataceae bacterium]|nr:hypothetical protein [Gemmataceae bacterium]